MLVVMLVLLASTATATFAVHATTFEIKASGHHRVAMQTSYVAEGGLQAGVAMAEVYEAAAIRDMIRLSTPPDLQPYEPALLPASGGGYRIYSSDFDVASPAFETAGASPSLGPGNAYRPFFITDIYDTRTEPCPEAGESVSAGIRCLFATVTARGRTQVAGDVRNTGEFRDYHEGATDTRAFVNLGRVN